jgi:hypothetical protein
VEYLDIGCRCAIGVIFAVSAISKLAGKEAFASFGRSLRRMRVVPKVLNQPVAVAVVAAELSIPILLLVPLPATGIAGFVIAAGLLLAFIVGIANSLRIGDRTPCACFGRSTIELGPRHIVRNIVLILLAGAGLFAVLSAGTPQWGLAAIAGVAGLVIGGLVTAFDDIYSLFAPSVPGR